MTDPVLDIKDLSIDFLTPRGRLQALRNLDLTVPAKQVVGVVGESGCGKSTLILAVMRLLAGNAMVTGGRIMFEGQNILEMSTKELRNIRGTRISMVFQDPMTSLNPVRSIGNQMMDTLYRENMNRSDKRKRIIEMLGTVGISDPDGRMQQYPHHFSGGMRQRITIAMALLADPALLIADEPTTALDATLEVQVIQLLKDLQKRIGCSILFVSHHLNVIAELCDHVMVMYAGIAVEHGTVHDIFKHAAHPYTRALLKCDPAVIAEKTRTLPTIPGEIPSLVNLPDGCIFAGRCAESTEICRRKKPEKIFLSDTHHVTCMNVQGHERK